MLDTQKRLNDNERAQRDIAQNVAKLAFQTVCEGNSYLSFGRSVFSVHLSSTHVGTVNRSKACIEKFGS